MSHLQKFAVAALVIAFSQCATPEAKADPLSKFFARAGEKAVGGISKSVQKNVSQSSKLILKAAPYALLQGSSSAKGRSTATGSGATKLSVPSAIKYNANKYNANKYNIHKYNTKQFDPSKFNPKNAIKGTPARTWSNQLPQKFPTTHSAPFKRPIYYGSRQSR